MKYLQWRGSKYHFFNFPHYKSKENLSCHVNQTIELIFIKDMGFRGDNFLSIFFCFLAFWFLWQPNFLSIFSVFFGILVSMATNENEQWIPNYMSDRRLLMKHLYVKVLSTYLQWLGSKCHFAVFTIIS